MPRVRVIAIAALLAAPGTALGQATKTLPMKHTPQPTSAAITAGDLMTRLYIFADDSMQGRETGTIGHVKSTNYIEHELRRMGLEPAGDSGFFQNVPVIRRSFDPASTITVDGVTLKGGVDFVATSTGNVKSIDGLTVIYGGVQGDTAGALTPDQFAGKLLVFKAPEGRGRGRGRGGFGGGGGRGGRGGRGAFAGAGGTVTIDDSLSAQQIRNAVTPLEGNVFLKPADTAQAVAPTVTATPHAAEILLGVPLSQATKGMAGKTIKANLIFHDVPAPARNLVAIVRGTDPKLKGEFVAMGAHNDHIGLLQNQGVDHDSLHLYNQARFAITGMFSNRGGPQPSQAQLDSVAAIHINLDSVRRIRPVRHDSIRNGADDDGSGTVTLLELAESFAKHPQKRSLLFVWHTGEEKGLWGSRFFTDHPTVPRDSIVAQLNMDMVGRGDKQDIPVGGPNYLELVGSRRLSTELGDLVEAVSKTEKMPFNFDYQFDANGHPENIYCRSDHANYARFNIPVVFFTTGLHGDYHQVTDEPQYIDYEHMARIGQLVHDVAVRVANLDHRVVVDSAKRTSDPNARCQQ